MLANEPKTNEGREEGKNLQVVAVLWEWKLPVFQLSLFCSLYLLEELNFVVPTHPPACEKEKETQREERRLLCRKEKGNFPEESFLS